MLIHKTDLDITVLEALSAIQPDTVLQERHYKLIGVVIAKHMDCCSDLLYCGFYFKLARFHLYIQNLKLKQKPMDPEEHSNNEEELEGDSEQLATEQGPDYFDGDDDEEVDLMDAEGDMASSDSELQVQDPSQEMNEQEVAEEEENNDPMQKYLEKEAEILSWMDAHPGQKWVDFEFPCNSSQFYDDPTNMPIWGSSLKNLEWKRPEEIVKDPKFMIVDEDKQGRIIDIDAKHGVFAASSFIGALTIAGTKTHIIEKLIIEKEYFDKGFVAFQFFKNGSWTQVVVDTLLPYEKQHNSRVCLYSCCANPQQFWIQLIEKAYVKLHKNYENICKSSIEEGLVDLTGGVAEPLSLNKTGEEEEAVNAQNIWNVLLANYQQKFLLGCINAIEGKDIRNAQQGQQGILENHFYTIIDMRDFPKDNLKLIRLRNPWGNQGVWTGAFCEEADDWEKYKAVKQQLKNVPKTKKIDGSWWMSFPDFLQQFDNVAIGKIFPQSWETYSIEGQWAGKTNGGRCPTNLLADKTTFMQTKEFKEMKEFVQFQSDDRWFNNPQYRIKVNKDTRLYISLMQEDEKISGQPYVPVSFMIATTKSKTERIWERPPEPDIIAQVNASGAISNARELTHYLTLKKHEGKQKIPKIYMIIPNIVDHKDVAKKDDPRKFYLRLLSPDALDVSELPETLETSVEGQWTETTAGGSRKIQVKEEGAGKKKGEIKDNSNWCRNPQYFLTFPQTTMMKIILRKTGTKKFKGWKIGMTICRYGGCDQNGIVRPDKADKSLGNLQKLLKQTDQFLEPPVLEDVERKLLIQPNEKFRESMYFSEDVSALFFKWNPTEGPFIIIPSSDGQERFFGYKLTISSNNPVNLVRMDDVRNQVMIGKWEKDISAGGCHLNELEKESSQRTWSMNPKYLLTFKEEDLSEQPVRVKVTLSIAEKNWKKLNPNTVNGMIGLYLLNRPEGKLTYNKHNVVNQTNFLPVKEITMETVLGGEESPINPNGYVIMPSTYQSKVQGSFIVSVKCDRPFELTHFK